MIIAQFKLVTGADIYLNVENLTGFKESICSTKERPCCDLWIGTKVFEVDGSPEELIEMLENCVE